MTPRSVRPDVTALVAGVRERRARQLGQAISLVEGREPERRELIAALYDATGKARVVGITGPPGCGKSTLVDRLAGELREAGDTVGILAIDPTSPFSGGAILGDRIRMQSHYTDDGVFIRSMATRGTMGGLAAASHDAIDILDAAGFDWILVETVGVGQDEVDIVRSVDTVVVLTVPGLGDEIQAIKAGLMEIADIFVINKADREGADRSQRDIESMISMAEPPSPKPSQKTGQKPQWTPPITQTVASRGDGIEEVLEEIRKHRQWLVESGEIRKRRGIHLRLRVENLLEERILLAAEEAGGLDAVIERGLTERADPYLLAEHLFAEIIAGGHPGEGTSIRGIDHVGIAVESIDRAKRFYEALGLDVGVTEEVVAEGVRVAMIPLGSTRIELLEATREDSPIAKFLEKRGQGMHHLCFSTDDIRGDVETLRSAGVDLLGEQPTRGAEGCWVQFVHPRSAGGVLIELSQPAQPAQEEKN